MPMNDTDPQDTLLTPYEGRSILAVPIALLIAIPLYRVVGSLAGGLSLAGIFSVWWLAIPTLLVVAAILNFIVMTIRRADSSYPSRGFWAALLIWILIFSVARYISTADERRAAAAAQRTEAIKLAADGDDLQAFQTAVKNCRLHCDRYYTLEVLYNQLAIRGKTSFVEALQSGAPGHLGAIAPYPASRDDPKQKSLYYCATGTRVQHDVNGLTAALFGLDPALRQVMLDYAKPDELNHGLHYAIRADAPERVSELLKRGASLEQAMLIHYRGSHRRFQERSDMALLDLLIDAKAVKVLKWLLTDGRTHFDALPTTRDQGKGNALHLWAQSAGRNEAALGTLDGYLPMLDLLLSDPSLRTATPIDAEACRTECEPPVMRVFRPSIVSPLESCKQCGPVEIAWGTGAVGSVKALLDRGVPITQDRRRERMIRATLKQPMDAAILEAQETNRGCRRGDYAKPGEPKPRCLEAYLAEQAAGPHKD